MPTPTKLVVCHECDLISEDAALAPSEAAYCPRCRAKLYRRTRATPEQTLAITLTAAILFCLMNTFPLMALNLQQTSRATTLFGATLAMWNDNMHALSLLVMLTTILAPALQITLEIYILMLVKNGKASAHKLAFPMFWLQKIRPWSMVEVFMLGLLVSLVKLQDLAEIIIGPAFWSCAGLIFSSAIMSTILTPRNIWHWAHSEEWHGPK
jgi:paraquat-inducible protein A